jgi:hypothetical protein
MVWVPQTSIKVMPARVRQSSETRLFTLFSRLRPRLGLRLFIAAPDYIGCCPDVNLSLSRGGLNTIADRMTADKKRLRTPTECIIS